MGKNKIIISAIIILLFNCVIRAEKKIRPYKEHLVYFKNTPNELNVYKLYGRQDGKTVFILGGIQGDEPGGFLSADLYPDLVLEKGNLIVIPRANFHSIILNKRGVNGDMNRKFQNNKPKDVDDQIVNLIKQFMSESDLFLNLHDGWGFYRVEYIDEMRNPYRFGQSVIADADFYVKENGDTISLKKMADTVIEKVNKKIINPEHHFHFMNTRTNEPNTPFADQRKSATFFALTNYNIPAFGIETSKNLKDLELKIRYHNYVINEFLNLMGVEPEHPAILYEPPRLIYAMIVVNDRFPNMVIDGSVLNLYKGDNIKVTHIESNYKRGLTCDILNVGSEQDYMKDFEITQTTKIIFRKDNFNIGEVGINVNEMRTDYVVFLTEVNGKKQLFFQNDTLKIHRGDKLRIINVLIDGMESTSLTVNLKGFVPNVKYNTGEDRGYLIDTGNLYWKKYSLYGMGKVYPIVVTRGAKEVAKAFLRLQ